MFEVALLTYLSADAELVSYVSTFADKVTTRPSIFAERAPEGAQYPYLIFKIRGAGTVTNLAARDFTVFFDYFDYGKSPEPSRKAAERLEVLLDRHVLESDRFSYIRFFYFDGSPIDELDVRSVHYNLQFSARAGRKAWIEHITKQESTTIEP